MVARARAFLPHFTLARLKRSSGPVGNLLEQSGGLTSPPFAVDHFALFESTLTPDGAVYTIAERYPLARESTASSSRPTIA